MHKMTPNAFLGEAEKRRKHTDRSVMSVCLAGLELSRPGDHRVHNLCIWLLNSEELEATSGFHPNLG